MKTEEFDDAVRQKLSSINQSYTEGDIDKVFDHVKKNHGFQWKGFNGSWIIYSLSAAAMVMVTTWAIYKYNEGKVEVKQAVKSTQPIQPLNHTVAEVGDTSDNQKSLSALRENIIKTQSDKSSSSAQKEVQPDMTQASKIDPVSWTSVSKNSQTGNKQKTAEKETVNVLANTSGILTDGKQVTVIETESKVPDVPVFSETTTPEIPSSKGENEKSIPILTEKETIGLSNNPVSGNADTSALKLRNPIRKLNLFEGSSFRTAVAFRISGQRLGTGIYGEVLFAKHFGINAGVTYNFLQAENFTDKNDFSGHKEHGFNHGIDDHFRDQDHVTDISINSRLLQVPFSLSYYIPLKKSFAIRASLGTDLDIYLKQQVKYNHHQDSTANEIHHFTSSGDVTVFNNIVFGAGLEKKWNRFVINLDPYYIRQIKQPFYKPKQNEFGLEMNLIYCFGKKR